MLKGRIMRVKSNFYVILFILSLLIPAILLNAYLFKNQFIEESSVSEQFLRTSSSEINIITPLNTTYTAPMNGYYPATYGFENDEIGGNPNGWSNQEIGGSITVISNIDNHEKVVEFIDPYTNNFPLMSKTFGNMLTGTIEYWVYKNSGLSACTMGISGDAGESLAIRVDYQNNGKFEYGGPTYIEFGAGLYSDQTWFHIRIDFDVSTDTVDIYLNGQLEVNNGAFSITANYIDTCYFGTNYGSTGSYYLDAVGFSWDSDYNIGDNMNEGLLLGYENSTILDWMGYSLDGAANITIQGNTTIPLPEDGHHTIQVSGTSPGGIDYQSNVRHFTVKNSSISIITPENTTYTAPMSGYYPATYGFENDKVGGNEPYSWNNSDIIGTKSGIINEKFGHYNVLQQDTSYNNQSLVKDTNDKSFTLTGNFNSWSAAADRQITYTSDILSLEAYMMAVPWTGISGPHPAIARLSFSNPTAATWGQYYATITFNNNNGNIEFSGGSSLIIIGNYNPYSWYHAKLVVNITDNSAKAYLNGKFMAETYLAVDASEITHVRLFNGHTSLPSYFDNVICSQGVTEQLIFEEDFDSYAVGSFPSTFVLTYNGLGNEYQVVTNTYAFPNSQANLWHDMDPQPSGSVEFYMGHDGYQSELANLNIMFSSGTSDVFGLQMRFDGKWTYWDGYWQPLGFGNHIDGEFYHVSIIFRCSSTTPYEGLADTYTWKVYINGINYSEFSMNVGLDVDRISLFTSGVGSNDYGYWDAIGYSWDPNYNIGDNINEGLLLSYDNSTVLTWMGYSLDGNNNITIQGNTTIPLPDDGTHTIQVSGISPLGIDYHSDVRYFTINTGTISIISPENITYTAPMSGYYPATYGFENDADGTDPQGWTIVEPGLQEVDIISNFNGHDKVLRLFDTESGAGDHAWATKTFLPQTTGIIEFWYMTSGYQETCNIRTYEAYNTNIAMYFCSNMGNFDYYNGTDWISIATCNSDQWYHIKFEFDCSSDTYDIYIDGNLIFNNALFSEPVTSITTVDFVTRQLGTSSDYYMYIDAIGVSWDPDYTIGDNMNEGLLLSYKNSTVLDWMGYSLDGATNITIQGNTTIPMPTGNGLHSIQVFGTTTEGYTIESEKRVFSLDWEYVSLKPTLNILDMIYEFGLHFEIDIKSIGFLHVDRQTFTFPGLPQIGYNRSMSYFYSIDIYNSNFIKDSSILTNMTVRFYYDPLEINDPGKLQLYHYISSTGQWRAEDILINTAQHYVEFSTTELSYFCLSEIDISIIPVPWFIIIIIIILSMIGLSIPSGYVILSRRKDKRNRKNQPMKKKEPLVTDGPSTPVDQFVQINIFKPPISPEMITPIKTVESKNKTNIERPKKAKRSQEEEPKILDVALSQKIIEELRKVESEIEIKKDIDHCIVHKGQIIGLSYVCPKCFSKYCINCAQALEERQERCWVCETPINTNQEPPKYSTQLKKIVGNNLIGTYTISSGKIMERLQSGGNLTTISDKFWEDINKFDWEGNDKEEFIKEMLSLTPKERHKIIDLMLKTKYNKSLPK